MVQAVSERQQAMEGQLSALAATLKALEARMAEIGRAAGLRP
jgi:prefoldin subunit 5